MKPQTLHSVRSRSPTLRPSALILAASMAMAASAAAQTTLYVNADCGDDTWSGLSDICQAPDGPKATIQAAIDGSISGDEVVVADGIYAGPGNRDLDFAGRLIVVRSANGAEACEINCAGRSAESHRGFVFQSGETAEAVVQGFTIRNGYAENGGAIWCLGSSPTILECRFLNNNAEPQDIGFNRGCGGALYCLADGTLTVKDCHFEGNIAHTTGREGTGWGGAIGAGEYNGGDYGALIVERCTFVRNDALNYGAGVCALGYDLTVRDCVFQENAAFVCGGGVVAGGDVLCLFEQCSFAGNTVQGHALSTGGAAFIDMGATGRMVDCEFLGNHSDRRGGALKVYRGAQVTAVDCTFIGNSSSEGGAVGLDVGGSQVGLVNCTISRNDSPQGGALWVGDLSQAAVSNSILWSNTTDEIYHTLSGLVTVTYSIVQGGWDGAIDADPLFADPAAGNFHVLAYSPAIDSADNTALPPEIMTDLDGLPRFRDDPWMIDTGVKGGSGGDLVVDMGAYEFQGASCSADFDADGVLDTRDVLAFLNAWAGHDAAADCDENGVIDTRDVLCFLNLWSAGC